MARVNTNNTSLRYTIESSVGVAGTAWRIAEFNTIGSYGATIATTVRRPISQDRGRKKGTVTDLDSAVEFETDLTWAAFNDFAEGFVFAEYANKEFNLRASSGTVPPPVASSTTFTIDAASATLGTKAVFSTGSLATLLYAHGYTNSNNNGLHALTVDLAATQTSVTVGGSSLTTETPPTGASLQIAGLRVLDDADLTLTVSGSFPNQTATLVSAAAISNWSTYGLQAGMFIHIGSPNSSGALQNALGAGGTTSYGYARIVSISGATLNLDKLSSTLSTATGPASASQDIMFGRFLRNVPVTAAATDNEYLERTYQFEVSYPDLGGVGTDEYEYAVGNYANELSLNIPLTDKATINFGFIGTNSEDITSTRKSGASSAVTPLRTTAFNTSSDIVSISTNAVSAVSEICFKSMTLTLLNNATREKCLGTLGATFVNSGLFEVNLEGQMLFTNKTIVNAIKNNTTVTFLAILRNQDGAIAFDIPSMNLGNGGREFPLDQSVLVNISGASFTSPTLGYDVGITLFPAVPYA
jgi:hypothetical protein